MKIDYYFIVYNVVYSEDRTPSFLWLNDLEKSKLPMLKIKPMSRCTCHLSYIQTLPIATLSFAQCILD